MPYSLKVCCIGQRMTVQAGIPAVAAHNIEYGDTVSHGNVQRLFRPELRYLEGHIRFSDELFAHAMQFITYYKAERKRGFLDIHRRRWAVRYFKNPDRISVAFERLHDGKRISLILPPNRVLRSESRFVQTAIFRGSGNTRQIQHFDECSVRGAEHRPDIVDRSYIVEEHGNGMPGKCMHRFWIRTRYFLVSEFAHR